MAIAIAHFFDAETNTLTYVVSDRETKDAVVIDPVLNLELATGRVSLVSNQDVLSYVRDEKLNVEMILETHAHADHLSGAHYLKMEIPRAKLGIGEDIMLVQEAFASRYGYVEFPTTGEQFDLLFEHDKMYSAGSLNFRVLKTPGHTPACVSYLFEDAVFVGDALFMPDFGTGRCDFPGGSASDLFHSVHEVLYGLPDQTKVFVGHDYCPNGRDLRFETSIKESKSSNKHIRAETTEKEFVAFRTERDQTLSAPKLLHPSLQVNIQAGRIPEGRNGFQHLTIPLAFNEM